MKKLLTLFIIGLATITFAPKAHAFTPINGEAYGSSIGAVQMDVASLAPSQHIGIYQQTDGEGRCGNSDTDTTSPTYPSNYQWCELAGYAYNDTIGWLVFDGEPLDAVLPDAEYRNPGDYPRAVLTRSNGSLNINQVPLTGFVWSEHGGWIRLSSDLDYGVTTNPGAQTSAGYGIFIDYPDGITEPGVIRGNAWSSNLGWIKFSPEDEDEEAVFAGTTVNFTVDGTPPEVYAINYSWFPNQLSSGVITWEAFAQDPETSITDVDLAVNIPISDTGDPNFFIGCRTKDTIAFNTENLVEPYGATDAVIDLVIDGVGHVKATEAGYCKYELTGTITNGVGGTRYIMTQSDFDALGVSIPDPSWRIDPLVFYTRAGEIDDDNVTNPDSPALADGWDEVTYILAMQDIADNPIRSVSPYDQDCINNPNNPAGCPSRSVSASAYLDNTMQFDATGTINNNSSPVLTNGDSVSSGENVILGLTENENQEQFEIDLASYSPTVNNNSERLTLNDFKVTLIDAAIPAQTNQLGGDYLPAFNNSGNPLEILVDNSPEFTPAVITHNATTEPSMVVGAPNSISYDISNLSDRSLSSMSIDNVLEFFDTAIDGGAALMELHEIQDKDSNTGDFGQTDPINPPARYQLFTGDFVDGSPLASDNNELHTNAVNLVPSYTFYEDEGVPTTLNEDGVYEVARIYSAGELISFLNNGTAPDTITNEDGGLITAGFRRGGSVTVSGSASNDGKYQISEVTNTTLTLEESESLTTEEAGVSITLTDSLFIDRSEPASLPIDPLTTQNRTLNFTPEQWLEGDASGTSIRLRHLISYKRGPQPHPTIYKPEPIMEGVGIQAVGVKFTGIAAGRDIYELDENLTVIGSPEARGLKEQIRRNVASLSTGGNACDVDGGLYQNPVYYDSDLDTSFLRTSGRCAKSVNDDSVITFYEGDPGEVLTLQADSESEPIIVPADTKYTLVVSGGASVYLNSNFKYGSTASSFGLIVLQDENGEGGNIYLDETPTNMVGYAFAEGSLLSIKELDATNTPIYYYGGPSAPSVTELNNQLYWQGSLVTKNTIGGAEARRLPQGVNCLSGVDIFECAKRYDLNYLRRFAVFPDGSGNFISADGATFSGGGSCDEFGSCSEGPDDLKAFSSIELSGDKIDVDNSVVDPFYIIRDPRLDSFTPPGFNVNSTIFRNQEIR